MNDNPNSLFYQGNTIGHVHILLILLWGLMKRRMLFLNID